MVNNPPDVQSLSVTTQMRLRYLHYRVAAGARHMANPDGYADFFVETPRGSFNEAPIESSNPGLIAKVGEFRAARRMSWVDDVIDWLGDIIGYSDFFAEGPPEGPNGSWHEAWEEIIEGGLRRSDAGARSAAMETLLRSPRARAQGLSKLKVVQAYERLRSGDAPTTERDY